MFGWLDKKNKKSASTHEKTHSISMDEPIPKDFDVNSSTSKIKFAIGNSISINSPNQKEKEIIKIIPTNNTTIGTLSKNQAITLPIDNSTDNNPDTETNSNQDNRSFCDKYCTIL